MKQKRIDPAKCDACQKKKKWRRCLRLCVTCWAFVTPELQGAILSGFKHEYDTQAPPREWVKLLEQAVAQAGAKLPTPAGRQAEQIICVDIDGVQLHPQDKVLLLGMNVHCLVLGLLPDNAARVRILIDPPDIQVVPGTDLRLTHTRGAA